ncbi:tetratricopeptide repeat protein [Prevotella sp.]|uniref:tetratricopeptide repeat protein n=1 Tax=Prevotella sp. TaxID=59823 RepID=UPI0026496711|nr:tetratricopeptide repeat protein [Prevotella sp.]MDN5553492.1 tetratricopeptide repeat protein [Prevotella sp.]
MKHLDQSEYFEQDDFLDILKEYEEARKNGKDIYLETDVLANIAGYYETRDNSLAAIDTIDYAIRLYPGDVYPLVFRARMAILMEDDIVKAKKYLKAIIDKHDIEYYYAVAEVKIAEGHPELASKYLKRKANDIEEDDAESYIIEVATLFADYKELEIAKKWIDTSNNPDDPDYWQVKGQIELGLGNLKESEFIYNSLLDKEPYSTEYWNQLASTQLLNSEFSDCISSSEFSIAINPNDADAILNKSNGLFGLENFEESLKYSKRYIELCPDEYSGYILQGMALNNLGRYEEAIDIFNKALKNCPDYPPAKNEIYEELTNALSLADKLDEAIKIADDCYKNSGSVETILNKGNLYLQHGDMENAREVFERAAKESNNNPETYVRISAALMDNGYVEMAYKILHCMINDDEAQSDKVYVFLAACCKTLGYEDEFKKAVKKAVKKTPNEAKKILKEYFPENMDPKDYYKYLTNTKKDQ